MPVTYYHGNSHVFRVPAAPSQAPSGWQPTNERRVRTSRPTLRQVNDHNTPLKITTPIILPSGWQPTNERRIRTVRPTLRPVNHSDLPLKIVSVTVTSPTGWELSTDRRARTARPTLRQVNDADLPLKLDVVIVAAPSGWEAQDGISRPKHPLRPAVDALPPVFAEPLFVPVFDDAHERRRSVIRQRPVETFQLVVPPEVVPSGWDAISIVPVVRNRPKRPQIETLAAVEAVPSGWDAISQPPALRRRVPRTQVETLSPAAAVSSGWDVASERRPSKRLNPRPAQDVLTFEFLAAPWGWEGQEVRVRHGKLRRPQKLSVEAWFVVQPVVPVAPIVTGGYLYCAAPDNKGHFAPEAINVGHFVPLENNKGHFGTPNQQ